MKCTGKVVSVTRDWQTDQLHITFSINERSAAQQIDSIKDLEKLTIEAKQYREKRSLNANKYAWALIGELASVMRTSQDEVYEIMLSRYGTNEVDEDGNTVKFSVISGIDCSKLGIHCAFIGKGHVGDRVFDHYRVIKGSSQYDTKEMSVFIDGIVSECKELGIETITPRELEQMKQAWKGDKR